MLPRNSWDLQAKISKLIVLKSLRSDPLLGCGILSEKTSLVICFPRNVVWSLANQNKSFLSLQTSQLSFSVKHFTLSIRRFSKEMFFERIFFKGASDWIQGVRLLKSNTYRQNRQKYPFTGAQEPIKWWRTIRERFAWNLKKYLGLVSFWAPLKGCFWNKQQKQGHRFYEFSISHFPSLETECTEAAVCRCFQFRCFLKSSQYSQEKTFVRVSF